MNTTSGTRKALRFVVNLLCYAFVGVIAYAGVRVLTERGEHVRPGVEHRIERVATAMDSLINCDNRDTSAERVIHDLDARLGRKAAIRDIQLKNPDDLFPATGGETTAGATLNQTALAVSYVDTLNSRYNSSIDTGLILFTTRDSERVSKYVVYGVVRADSNLSAYYELRNSFALAASDPQRAESLVWTQPSERSNNPDYLAIISRATAEAPSLVFDVSEALCGDSE